MFAMRLERNVLEQHDFIVTAHLLECTGQMGSRVLDVSLAVFLPGARNALGRVGQAFAVRVVACPEDQLANRLLDVVGNKELPFVLEVRKVVSEKVHVCFLMVLGVAGRSVFRGLIRLWLSSRGNLPEGAFFPCPIGWVS